jgi:hypothetical protein
MSISNTPPRMEGPDDIRYYRTHSEAEPPTEALAPPTDHLPTPDTRGVFNRAQANFATHVAKPIQDLFSKQIELPEGSKRKLSLTGLALLPRLAAGKFVAMARLANNFIMGHLNRAIFVVRSALTEGKRQEKLQAYHDSIDEK